MSDSAPLAERIGPPKEKSVPGADRDLLAQVKEALQKLEDARQQSVAFTEDTDFALINEVRGKYWDANRAVVDRAPEWLAQLVERVEQAENQVAEWERRALELDGEMRVLEAETTRLRQFFEKCWDNARDGTDVEGGDVQDWGEQLGLLKPVQANAPCGEGCYCAEYYGEFPATCYRLAWGAALAGETPPKETA